MKIVALVPAHNEADCIVSTIDALTTIASLAEIVVINDGSTDQTQALVEQFQDVRVRLLSLPENQGKGAALNVGVESAPADVYLLVDADLGSTAHLAKHLLEPVLEDDADMAIATFETEQSLTGGKMGFGFARRSASWGVQRLTGTKVQSPLSGQRAIKACVLQKVGDFFSGFGVEVGLTVGALHHGFRIREIPLAMKHRAYGRGLRGFKHRGRQWLRVWHSLWLCWRKGWHL